jgi:hypothetical protein
MADDEQHPTDHPAEVGSGADRPAPGPDGDETQRVVTSEETTALPGGETAPSQGDETSVLPAAETTPAQGDEAKVPVAPSPGDETSVIPAAQTAPPDGDETAVMAHGGEKAGASQVPAGGDETQVLAAADATQVLPDGDATQVIANGDQTAVIPPRDRRPAPGVDQTAVLPPMPAWAGRAEVRPPGAGGVRQAVPPDEWQDYGDGGRRWWLPIVLGILGLLMLGVLGAGVWLIMRTQNDKPAPAASATASVRPSQTSASPSPTTASPSPTASGPVQVLVPPLVGLTAGQAETLLQQNHLNFQLLYRYDPNTLVGNVIEANPVVGTLVDQGSTVTLVISSPASSSPSPSPSAKSVSPSATSASPTR